MSVQSIYRPEVENALSTLCKKLNDQFGLHVQNLLLNGYIEKHHGKLRKQRERATEATPQAA